MASSLNGTGVTFSDNTTQSTALNTINDITATEGAIDGVTTLGTVNTSSAVTSKAFTGIPSWVTRITMTFVNVTPTSTNTIVQIGSGSYTTSGYVSVGQVLYAASGATQDSSQGFSIYTSNGYEVSGQLTLVKQTGNVWTCTHLVTYALGGVSLGAGHVSLSGAVDRIRLYSETGTPTFTGNVNIMYE